MIDFRVVDQKANEFYDRWCLRRKKKYNCLPCIAADWAYKASVNVRDHNHVIFGYRVSFIRRLKIRKNIIPIIADFLSKKDYSSKKCFELMTQIRSKYHKEGIEQYTYGNAQKWVNMSIKYYIILNSFSEVDKRCNIQMYLETKGYSVENPYVFDYHLFPVDSIFSETINEVCDVDFLQYSNGKSWHLCDDIETFKKYYQDVEKKLEEHPLFLFEIEKWG